MLVLEAGYDWTPWLWRLQPFVPLRLRWASIGLQNQTLEGKFGAQLYGASAGLGLRYWLTGELLFEGGLAADIPFNSQELGGDNDYGGPFHITKDAAAPALALDGTQLFARVKWAGF